jgi:hypothetical protein
MEFQVFAFNKDVEAAVDRMTKELLMAWFVGAERIRPVRPFDRLLTDRCNIPAPSPSW